METQLDALPEEHSRPVWVMVWIARLMVIAVFVPAGITKLVGTSMSIREFELIGFGTWFRYFTGVLELAGAVLAFVPPLSAFGTLLLLAVDVGAFVAQVTVLHMDWIHTIVIGAVLVTLAYLQRAQLTSRRAER